MIITQLKHKESNMNTANTTHLIELRLKHNRLKGKIIIWKLGSPPPPPQKKKKKKI